MSVELCFEIFFRQRRILSHVYFIKVGQKRSNLFTFSKKIIARLNDI